MLATTGAVRAADLRAGRYRRDWYTGAQAQAVDDSWAIAVDGSTSVTSNSSAFGSITVTAPLAGPPTQSGPRVRVEAIAGTYSYPGQAVASRVTGYQEGGLGDGRLRVGLARTRRWPASSASTPAATSSRSPIPATRWSAPASACASPRISTPTPPTAPWCRLRLLLDQVQRLLFRLRLGTWSPTASISAPRPCSSATTSSASTASAPSLGREVRGRCRCRWPPATSRTGSRAPVIIRASRRGRTSERPSDLVPMRRSLFGLLDRMTSSLVVPGSRLRRARDDPECGWHVRRIDRTLQSNGS